MNDDRLGVYDKKNLKFQTAMLKQVYVTTVDNAEDLDIVMAIYNLSVSYAKTLAS